MSSFNWVENYFGARVLLGFSEEEFWRAHPRKIYALLYLQGIYQGRIKPSLTASDPKSAAKELMGILGSI